MRGSFSGYFVINGSEKKVLQKRLLHVATEEVEFYVTRRVVEPRNHVTHDEMLMENRANLGALIDCLEITLVLL